MKINKTSIIEQVWLTEDLKSKIRKVFEPRYKRQLSNEEIIEIAENLSNVIEQIVKVKWKEKYERRI